MSFTLEICCYNYRSCLIAAQAGANRIELCADAAEGGTTPAFGTIKLVKERLGIDVYPIIRPRGGDFFYDEEEFIMMKSEILLCKELGCEGVVIGMLKQDGSIDKEHCKRLAAMAYPMGVTFHRAFDRVSNPFEAMEDIITVGCERILTSGHKPVATEGAQLLDELIRQANDRIIIMPGSGIRAANIAEVAKKTGAVEFHSSAKIKINSDMLYTNESMQEQLQNTLADKNEIIGMRENLAAYFAAERTE
jgi:copper homeostasis protein